MRDLPKVSFGIIVVNGEPFTRYCLRALYPYAHEIIVVEGGSRHAAAMCSADGHSTDGTLDVLHEFKAKEDPAHKLQIVTRDGFWPEKIAQSQAYAERVTGDWLWQVDIDEFYLPQQMERVLSLIAADPTITAISLLQIAFWGDLEHYADGFGLKSAQQECWRVFRFGPGFRYTEHRPPTVLDPRGRNMLEVNGWLGRRMAREGIYLLHYESLFQHQVRQKVAYYTSLSEHMRALDDWYRHSYLKLDDPYHVHRWYKVPSWLERYTGDHPPQIKSLFEDMAAGRIVVQMRPMDDVARLLRDPRYLRRRAALRALAPLYGHGTDLLAHRPWWLTKSGLRGLRQRLSPG
jgi:glycosyltransferase involved in cell wall biosynthesis